MTSMAQQVPLFGLQAWHWQQALHALSPGGQCLDPRLTKGDLKPLCLQNLVVSDPFCHHGAFANVCRDCT